MQSITKTSITNHHLKPGVISRRLAEALPEQMAPPYPEFPLLSEYLHGDPKPAAVLIPLLTLQDKWHVLLTRRNPDLPEHSDQVAFPGGRSDPEDQDPIATALRETYEEIGIAPQDVIILGRLHDFITITNYRVTPIVGQIPWPYQLNPKMEEVSRVFTIPIDWLADQNNSEERIHTLPEVNLPLPVVYYREYDGEVLWGASARFMKTLMDIILQQS